MYRARISLPVPLSPWSRTGTLAVAAMSTLRRTASIAVDDPKITSSGGNSESESKNEELGEALSAMAPFLELVAAPR